VSARTLAIVTQDPTQYGGVLRLVEYLYGRAEAAGFMPEVLHYASFKAHPELHSSFINIARGELNIVPKEKRYEFRGMRSRAFGVRFPAWEPQRIRSNARWRKALNEYDVAILVTGSAQTGLMLADSGKPFSAWISSTVEDDRRKRLASERSLSAWLEKRSLPIIRRAERRVLESAANVLAVSNDTRERLSALRIRSECWPFPIDTERFSPTAKNNSSPQPAPILRLEKAEFLFVGRASDPRKRIELFFEACSRLKAMEPNLKFTAIVISVPIAQTGSHPFEVEWRSGISEWELIECYRSATALVLTSEQEGLGIAAMEAMSCGTPVISTRCGGPETFIQDDVNGFFADSAEEIAARMLKLATDAATRSALAHAARRTIETSFSEIVWNDRFQKLLAGL
jgi:glycosyltransferase involved in cell wall biosynthesis